ncbi:MAG: microviridin/marinostatin family tricyclic proteinase inhibitor [Deltaproteobacteria bacterium]|nr:microviridin/marinostatin family tricyclic proteinase inhibitor [Deltaproteobacteria bacterium]
MSQARVASFFAKLATDATLAERATSLQGAEAALVALAREHGFEFTVAELAGFARGEAKLEALVERVSKDSALVARAAALAEGPPESAAAALRDLAKHAGLSFTPDEAPAIERVAATEPFFARFLVSQHTELSEDQLDQVAGGGGLPAEPLSRPIRTLKYPSDRDEAVTMKYPSDDDESMSFDE